MHLFQRRSKHAKESHPSAIKIVEATLRKVNTAPISIRAIISLLLSARKGYLKISFNDTLDDEDSKHLAHKICEKQYKFSPIALLQGYITSDWIILQNVYTEQKDFFDSQVGWASRLISAL